jgi:hypothetical protein
VRAPAGTLAGADEGVWVGDWARAKPGYTAAMPASRGSARNSVAGDRRCNIG